MTANPSRIHLLLTLLILAILQTLSQAQEIKIDKSSKVVIIQGKEYYLHKVKKGQTLYSIAKTYNVSLEIIYQENKEVEKGVKTGQEIKIPVHPGTAAPVNVNKQAEHDKAKTEPVKKTAQPVETTKDTITSKAISQPCESKPHPDVFNVALMLPLYLGEIDNIQDQLDHEPQPPGSYKSLRFIQFYEGFLIAKDSLEKAGFSCKLYVYDVDEDSSKINKLLRKPEMEKMDLMIGLLYGNIFSIVSQFATSHDITLINPLSNKHAYIEGRSNVVLANPSVNEMSIEIARFLAEYCGDNNIILLTPTKDNEKKSLALLKENLNNIALQKNVKCNSYHELAVSGITNSSLPPLLVRDKKNLLVLFSNDELVVANFIRQVKMLEPDINIDIFGMPGWADFKSIEPHDLVTYNFHTFSSSFIDYQDNDVKVFLKKFRENYATEPEENAFQGYDIAFYFFSALHSFGSNFEKCLFDFNQKLLSTKFKFKQENKDGIENTYLNIVKYDDYSLRDARK